MHEKLRTGPLAGLRVGLLHGRLDADEKEIIMRRFQRGEIDVLVATTVIEVGVDVPNATVMVVEHAERFGLAQLHQLRGRVGRGAAKSYCILMTGPRVSPVAEERLNAMVRTQDGFELAELDLSMRGPGEFFGTRQAGLPDFRVANLLRDREMLELAKQEAARFAVDPGPSVTPDERASSPRPPQRSLAAPLRPRRSRLKLEPQPTNLNSAQKGCPIQASLGWESRNLNPPISIVHRKAWEYAHLRLRPAHRNRVALHRKRPDLQIDAGNFVSAIKLVVTSALAQLGKPHVPGLAQLQSGPDQHAVDVDARLPLKLKQHVDRACIVGAAAQHPPSTAEDGAGQRLHQVRRLVGSYSLHLHGPRDRSLPRSLTFAHLHPHKRLIG